MLLTQSTVVDIANSLQYYQIYLLPLVHFFVTLSACQLNKDKEAL